MFHEDDNFYFKKKVDFFPSSQTIPKIKVARLKCTVSKKII